MRILILNGPNLGRLGTRQPEIYGTATGDDILSALNDRFPDVELDWRQTDDEAELMGGCTKRSTAPPLWC